MTTLNDELRLLAERVEAATGPDRELDGEIDRMFNERPKHGDYDAKESAFWRVKNGYSGLLETPDGWARKSFCALAYTASIDAAKTLWPREEPHLIPSDPRICTAMALRARASIEGGK